MRAAIPLLFKCVACVVYCLVCHAADTRDEPTLWMPILTNSHVYDPTEGARGAQNGINDLGVESEKNNIGTTLDDSFVPPMRMDVGSTVYDEPPSAEETIRNIRREAQILRARRAKPTPVTHQAHTPSPRPKPKVKKIAPKRIVLSPSPAPPPLVSPSPSHPPTVHKRLRHRQKSPASIPLMTEPEIPRIVAWNAGPPLCGASDILCNSRILRTTCHIEIGSAVGIGDKDIVNIAGFESQIGSLRDERTLTIDEPVNCNEIPIFADVTKQRSAGVSTRDPIQQTRSADESQPHTSQDVIDPYQMYTGVSMFRSLGRTGIPLCGTIDMPYECSEKLDISCDHTVSIRERSQEEQLDEAFLFNGDTLLLNFSATVAAESCHVATNKSEVFIHVNGLDRRLSSFHNQSIVTFVGDLFSSEKQYLRGQLDIAEGDKTIWTTQDLRSDISKGDIFGLQLPGIDAVWEAVVVKHTANAIHTAKPFPGNSLVGYSAGFAYRRQAQSGRVIGSAQVINKLKHSPSNSLLFRLHTYEESMPRYVEEEEDAELQLEAENDLLEEVASHQVKSLARAKAICYEWMHLQYKRILRLEGFTRLSISDIKNDSLVLTSSYCGDAFESVKLYRGTIDRRAPRKKPFPYGHNATVELDGTASVGNGSFIAVTTKDVCPVLMSGDHVQIADQICLVENCKPAMLTLKCETNTGAWHSKYTGVNYKIYRLPRLPAPSTGETAGKIMCMRDLRDLLSEKLRCQTLQCIRRIQALECAVHTHCHSVFSETIAGIESLRRNLDCKQVKLVMNTTHVSEIPQRVMASDDKFGFFTGQNA